MLFSEEYFLESACALSSMCVCLPSLENQCLSENMVILLYMGNSQKQKFKGYFSTVVIFLDVMRFVSGEMYNREGSAL